MNKRKVGITVGVFDLFHVGHLNLLERCKGMCDYLIVAVCGDDYVTQIKHKTPIYPADQRIRIISALKCVDKVVQVSIAEIEDKMLLIKSLEEDYAGDALANITIPVFLYYLGSDVANTALEILAKTKSQLAFHALENVKKFVNASWESKINKALSVLKISGVRVDNTIEFYKNILKY